MIEFLLYFIAFGGGLAIILLIQQLIKYIKGV